MPENSRRSASGAPYRYWFEERLGVGISEATKRNYRNDRASSWPEGNGSGRTSPPPSFLPAFPKKCGSNAKLFQGMSWRFCGISWGYDRSKSKVSFSKFLSAVRELTEPASWGPFGFGETPWKDRSTSLVLPKDKSTPSSVADEMSGLGSARSVR